MIRLVDCDSDVVMVVEADLTHRCPFVEEIDRGRVMISWRVLGKTIELHSLAGYLAGYAEAEISHEQITDRIRHDLSVLDGVELISVGSSWLTAGMEVACATSPIHPADESPTP